MKSASLGESSFTTLDDPHYNSKQPESTAENLDHQDLHERIGILGISDCTPTTRHTHTNPKSN